MFIFGEGHWGSYSLQFGEGEVSDMFYSLEVEREKRLRIPLGWLGLYILLRGEGVQSPSS